MNHQIPCFEFHDVSFTWHGERVILEHQSFTLPQGAFVLIRGPSGAGKSTLLRLMNRLEEAETGEISYLGQSLTNWNPSELRQQVAYLQQIPVIPDQSVKDHFAPALLFSRQPRQGKALRPGAATAAWKGENERYQA